MRASQLLFSRTEHACGAGYWHQEPRHHYQTNQPIFQPKVPTGYRIRKLVATCSNPMTLV